MNDKYRQLNELEELRKNGTISEEEYQRERQRILNGNPQASNDALGMQTNTYLLLMHLSQFAGFFVAGLGFAVPIIMWVVNKDKNVEVDRHGKNIINFIISWIIYYAVSAILIIVLIGIPLLFLFAILHVIFIIIAAVKANSNEFWKYPLTIPFFRVD